MAEIAPGAGAPCLDDDCHSPERLSGLRFGPILLQNDFEHPDAKD